MARFVEAGFDAEAVDTVVHTHLHADHVGWDTHEEDGAWVPTFTNARHLYTEAEVAHWKADEQRGRRGRLGRLRRAHLHRRPGRPRGGGRRPRRRPPPHAHDGPHARAHLALDRVRRRTGRHHRRPHPPPGPVRQPGWNKIGDVDTDQAAANASGPSSRPWPTATPSSSAPTSPPDRPVGSPPTAGVPLPARVSPPALRVTDPAALADLYGRHPEVHPYGLADLDEPFWLTVHLVPGG